MESGEYKLIQQRLHKVERRLSAALAGWVLSLLVVWVLGSLVSRAGSQPALVRTRGIEVTDNAGRLRITLDAVNNKPSVWLYDANGHRRLGLSLSAFGTPEVALKDPEAKTRIGMSVGLERAAELQLSDARGRPRAGLWVGYGGEPGLWLFDDLARARIGLKVLITGQPGLWLFDGSTGRILFSVP